MVSLVDAALAIEQQPFTQLADADVLPLALADDYRFKKAITETFDRETLNDTSFLPNRMLQFKREQKMRGAIGRLERYQRFGQYFSFVWHSRNPDNLRVRFEYRQAKLGDYVLAREVEYPEAKGNFTTNFQITGEDYFRDGHITSWRALLIRDDRVVAIKTSALWN